MMATMRPSGPTARVTLGRDRAELSRFARRTEGRALILLAVVSIITIILEPIVFTSYPVTLGRIALIGLVAQLVAVHGQQGRLGAREEGRQHEQEEQAEKQAREWDFVHWRPLVLWGSWRRARTHGSAVEA